VADHAVASAPLTAVELPIEVPAHELSLIWHERRHRDPDHRWLRAEILAAILGRE